MDYKFVSGKPLFLQLRDMIRTDIASGRYAPGEKLPGVRDMALWFGVNPNTMQRALSDLEAEGLVVTHGTSGRFVCPDGAVIDLAKEAILRELCEEFLKKCAPFGISEEEIAKMLSTINENRKEERSTPENE